MVPRNSLSPAAPGIFQNIAAERTRARRVAAPRRGRGNHGRARNYFSEFGSERFLGDFFSRMETSFRPEGGTGAAPFRIISVAVNFFPYSLSLASLSGRNVEPSSEIPANSPRDREYVSISARNVASVLAAASLPFGPAAAAMSAPSFTLLLKIALAPRGFITSRTKSVACPPN